MTKQTIVIDAGHGGKDPGAINGTYKEADAALEISHLLAEEHVATILSLKYTTVAK